MRITPRFELEGKMFVARENTGSGEVDAQTVFEYHQDGGMIWALYAGGEIVRGHLLGRYVAEDRLVFSYHHLNNSGALMTGKCETAITEDPQGKLQLNETWEWTSGDLSSGTSVLVEVAGLSGSLQ